MQKNQFYNKYSGFNINSAEMERKWWVHLREQEEMEFLRISAQGKGQTQDPNQISPESLYMDEDYMIDEQNYVL